MLAEPKLLDEPARQRAVERYQIVDTPEEEPFEKIVALIRQILRVPICTVTVVDRDRQWFKAKLGLQAAETPRSISFCTHTIRQSTAMVVPDALADPRFADNPLVTGGPGIRAYCGVPLLSPDGYPIGAVCAMDTSPREFPPTDVSILENFARVVVDELELRLIATTDMLTGAATRRAWTEQAGKDIARARRGGRPVSAALLDVDRFKSVNDTHGHPAGDEVLRRIAGIGIAGMRDGDQFGRLGGEEFAILFPDTALAEAAHCCDRLRVAIAAAEIAVPHPISVTASFGVVEIAPQETLDEALERADRALYAAKTGGRNRVVSDRPSRDEAAD